jgi:hypothetical protein
MTTLSIATLHADGSVTISANYSDCADVLDNPDGFPPAFVAQLEAEWRKHPWESKRITLAADIASYMASDGTINAIPDGWTFGYPHAYVGDGFLLCPACVKAQVIANTETGSPVDPEQMAVELFVYGETPQYGDTCDQCYQYIPGAEPYCGECGNQDRELISNPSGDLMLCVDCIANGKDYQ